MSTMRENPVFSPTQTTTFIRDETAWYLRYMMKRMPRTIGKKEIAGMLGTAFADGAATYHNGLPTLVHRPEDAGGGAYGMAQQNLIKKAAAVAVQSAKDSKAEVLAREQTVYSDQNEAWELLETRAAQAVFKYALNFPTIGFSASDIVASELSLPNHGHARIDLVLNSLYGPMVVDLKSKLTLDIKYQAQLLREFEESWQMLHYTWAYGDLIGERVRRFAILLHVLEPKSRLPVLHPVVVTPELLQIWEQSARQVWRRMEGIRTGTPVLMDPLPACSFNFFSKFGREDWADAISKCFLDESLLDAAYIKEKPRAESV